jgi:hypothetical protein
MREHAVFAGASGLDHGDPAELRTVLGLLDSDGPAETRGYLEVLAGVRRRLLAAAWDDLDAPSRRRVAGLTAGVAHLTAPGAGSRLADLLPAAHPLAAVLDCDFTPDDPGPDLARVEPLLRQYGTALDRWEDLVLATSRRFPPRRL